MLKFLLSTILLIFPNIVIAQSQKTLVRTELAQKREFFKKISLPAECLNIASRDYFAHSDGFIEIIPNDRKRFFKKGELILALDKKIIETKKQKAEVDFKAAKLNLERDASLLQKKIISQSDYEKTKIIYLTAEYNLAEAIKIFENNIIYAPFDGEISLVTLREGELVKNGDFLLNISNNNHKIIRFQIPHKYKINENEATAEIYAKDKITKVSNIAISDSLSPSSKNYNAKAYVLENNNLDHNSFVTVNIKYNFHEAISIPEKSIIKSDGKSKIYIAENNIAKLIEITTGDRANGFIEITSNNITKANEVIVDGVQKLKDLDEIENIKQ